MDKKATIPLKKSTTQNQKKVDIVRRPMRYDRLSFNFSFLTSDKNYNLEKLESSHQKKLLKKMKTLSSDHVTRVKLLRKEQGFEFIEILKKSITISEFINSGRFAECDSKYCIFRISNSGRVIGKIYNNLFYVLAIDTQFDLYEH